jgi:hypothetical protein
LAGTGFLGWAVRRLSFRFMSLDHYNYAQSTALDIRYILYVSKGFDFWGHILTRFPFFDSRMSRLTTTR